MNVYNTAIQEDFCAPQLCHGRKTLKKYCSGISLPLFVPSTFALHFLDPLTLSNSAQLEMPHLVYPKGLIRVLSETPPPFLTPSEVRPSPPSTRASAPNTVACSPSSPPSPHSPFGLVWTRGVPTSKPLLTTLQCLPVLTASQFYFRGRRPRVLDSENILSVTFLPENDHSPSKCSRFYSNLIR